MSFEQIQFEIHDGVGLITLNRPERMNAWTYQMSDELTSVIEQCNDDPNVGAMVMTGAGRGFCAGADIQDAFNSRIEGETTDTDQRNRRDWIEVVRGAKPLIAAVNGASIGVGATMILPFDVIFASETARFAMGFIKMGLVPELASSHFLVQRMGFGRASEMCLTGRLYSAAEAKEMGLVDHLVAPEALVEEALALGREMGANPSRQLRWVKELLTKNGSDTDLKAVQRREIERLNAAYETPEHKEAVAAFLEKRPPNFQNPGA
jgi:enoyl-CoA hydratase/carnithine racemase